MTRLTVVRLGLCSILTLGACGYPADWRCSSGSCADGEVCKGNPELPEGALPNHASGTDCYAVCSTEGLLTHLSGCADPERACLGTEGGVGVCTYFATGCGEQTCPQGFACESDVCRKIPAEVGCTNEYLDSDETGLDCGGPLCPACQEGRGCLLPRDCLSEVCENEVCQPSCIDNLRDGDETDVDCGGSCDPCGLDEGCEVDADCQSDDCTETLNGKVCNACGDGVPRGTESCDEGADPAQECPWARENLACTVCSTSCELVAGQPRYCGDGIVQAPDEECGELGQPPCGGIDQCDLCLCVGAAPSAPILALAYGIKELRFSWSAVAGATSYKMFEDVDGVGAASGYTQLVADPTAIALVHPIAVWQRTNALYQVQACNVIGCTSSSPVSVATGLVEAIGYFKASNTGANDEFSTSVALSADGNTLAVGAIGEASAALGVGQDETDNTAGNAGAVYVFTRSADTWSQQAYIKASNTGLEDEFGTSVALSADGNTLAVGAALEDSAATGVGQDETDNTASSAGAVYVFTRSTGTWSQQAYVKASNTGPGDEFGTSVALSADGNTLAVGTTREASAAVGVGQDETDNTALNAGAVYVFTRSATIWDQQAYVKASNTEGGDQFGHSVALSADGDTLAVGAVFEDSAAVGVGQVETDNTAGNAGAVYVFTRSAITWSQQAYVKASNTGALDQFGYSLALGADGDTLAVGAISEDSAAVGVGQDETDNTAVSAGAVYVFTRSAGTWSQQAYVKASNTGVLDNFGQSVALSIAGDRLAVGAGGEDSAALGVGQDETDNTAADAGAVYVFTRSGGTWSQQAYLKASNTGASDRFGLPVAMSGAGDTLAVGATYESSAALGVGGDQTDDTATHAGAVYLY